MLITRETDYAIRTLRALSGSGMLTVKQICERESIPIQFAYKILKKLERAGMINITRGAAGGYRLHTDLNHVTLLDLLHATGEDSMMNECMEEGYMCVRNCTEACRVHVELTRIQRALETELSRHSLAYILSRPCEGLPEK